MKELFKELLKPRSVITIMFYSTYCLLLLMGKPIDPNLEKIVWALLGFWFGEKIFNIAKNGGGKQ